MSRFRRTDDGHTQIVRDLRRFGCMVQSMAMIGDGCPDLLVIHAGKVFLLELKRPDGPPSGKALTPMERNWHANAAHRGVPVYVVDSTESALEAVGLMKVAA